MGEIQPEHKKTLIRIVCCLLAVIFVVLVYQEAERRRIAEEEYRAAMAQLQEAIAGLPETQRTVFNLRYFDEMKYSDISQLLGTSEGALKASYHIAVKKISAFFKRHD